VSFALFISRAASELDPVIVTIPRHVIDKVLAVDAGHPGSDGTTSLMAFMLTNESTEEGIRCQHAELGETEEAGSVSGLGVWCKCTTDGHYGRFDK